MIVISSFLFFVSGELLVRTFKPQEYFYPRYNFSAQYGLIPYAGLDITHGVPNSWERILTVNKYSCRGEPTDISNTYEKNNIVILGDSQSFGHGVNDGEEYAVILEQHLGNDFDVINLGSGGWGITQQIRRFYELGQLYSPKVVILQFSRNDLEDNLVSPVTQIQDGRFIFRDVKPFKLVLKKYLSRSILQRSQLYNFFRHRVLTAYNDFSFNNNRSTVRKQEAPGADEIIHWNLLELFAKDLRKRGINFIMFADSHQLQKYPYLEKKVMELDMKGLCDYQDTFQWDNNFRDKDYYAPDGHWGVTHHLIIGKRLSEIINNM